MIIAIDIGSVNLVIASLDKSGGIIQHLNLATPFSAQDTTDVIIAALAGQFTDQAFSEIIVGIPGPVVNNRVAWCSNLDKDWTGYDLAGELKRVFKVPVTLENDANLAGLSEVAILAQKPRSAVFLSIGAGIGSSILINGKLVEGLLSSAAGMTCLEYDGVIREWEKFASGKAIYQAYGKLAEDIKDKKIWEAITDRIARGILAIVPVVQPELIIIGGSMGKNFRKFSRLLKDMIDEKLSPQLIRPQIIAAHDPDLAVIKGAHYYVKARKK